MVGLLNYINQNPQQPQVGAAQPTPNSNDFTFRDAMGLLGYGLLSKVQNKNADVVLPAFQNLAAQKQAQRKQEAIQQFGAQIQNSNLTPEQKSYAQYVIQSGDEKAIESLAKFLTGGDNKPYTLKPGDIRYDARGNVIVDRSKDKSDLTGYRDERNKITSASLMPVDVRRSYIAQAAGMGYDATEANEALKNNVTIADLARRKGLDPANLPTPIYGTTVSSLTQIQKRQQALVEMESLGKTIAEWTKPYARRFSGYSIPAIIDAAKGENVDQLAKYLAARGAALDQAAIRVRTLGGQVGEGVLNDMVNSAMGKIEFPSGLVNSELYIKTQQYLDRAIRDSVTKANKVGLQPAKAEEPPQGDNTLRQHAEQAIIDGADREAVSKRYKEMTGEDL